MFVRVKTVVQGGQSYEYLQIVRSVRDGTRVRQELVASLGRRDLLVATGKLDQLLQALARFSTRLKVIEAAKDARFVAREAKSWGPALVFGRLWERQGLPAILDRHAAGRRFGFDPERVAFALALQRLCAPGSDLQGAGWAQTVEAPGFDDLALHHFYRTVPWLAAIRHRLEQDLFFQHRDLFSAEVDALSLTIARFRERFRIRRAVVVADRGMLGRATLALLRDHASAPFDYILGCPLRRERVVAKEVLARPGRYQQVADNLEVKEVKLGERRHVVCRNPIAAKQDAADREALLAKLRQTLAHDGPKAVDRHAMLTP